MIKKCEECGENRKSLNYEYDENFDNFEGKIVCRDCFEKLNGQKNVSKINIREFSLSNKDEVFLETGKRLNKIEIPNFKGRCKLINYLTVVYMKDGVLYTATNKEREWKGDCVYFGDLSGLEEGRFYVVEEEYEKNEKSYFIAPINDKDDYSSFELNSIGLKQILFDEKKEINIESLNRTMEKEKIRNEFFKIKHDEKIARELEKEQSTPKEKSKEETEWETNGKMMIGSDKIEGKTINCSRNYYGKPTIIETSVPIKSFATHEQIRRISNYNYLNDADGLRIALLMEKGDIKIKRNGKNTIKIHIEKGKHTYRDVPVNKNRIGTIYKAERDKTLTNDQITAFSNLGGHKVKLIGFTELTIGSRKIPVTFTPDDKSGNKFIIDICGTSGKVDFKFFEDLFQLRSRYNTTNLSATTFLNLIEKMGYDKEKAKVVYDTAKMLGGL